MRSLFILLLACTLQTASAQRIINGKVSDAVTGEKIQGATVTVASTGQKVAVDTDGRFIIMLPTDTSRIIISAPGMADLAIRPGAKDDINLMLEPAVEVAPPWVRSLYPQPHDEMPLPSYGWHWRPGIVPDSLLFRPGIVDDPAQLLQALTPGLLVSKGGTDPNENYVMRSRGLSSLIGNNQPQVWIDGVPAGDFFLLRNEDIASIRVLRSAAETALYGPGAAAGVILIETRNPTTEGWHARYNGTAGFGQSNRAPEVFSEAEYIQYGGIDPMPNEEAGVVYPNEVQRKSFSNTHYVGIDGSVGPVSMHASLGYQNREGILKGSGYTQYQGRIGLGFDSDDNRLHVRAGWNQALRQSDNSIREAFRYSLNYLPVLPPTSDALQYIQFDGYTQAQFFDVFNPVALLDQNLNLSERRNWLGFARADLEIVPQLSLALGASMGNNATEQGEYSSPFSLWRGRFTNGFARTDVIESQNQYYEGSLRYRVDGPKSVWEFQAGYNRWFNNREQMFRRGTDITSEVPIEDLDDILAAEIGSIGVGTGVAYDSSWERTQGGPFFQFHARSGSRWNLNGGVRTLAATGTGVLPDGLGYYPFAGGEFNFADVFQSQNMSKLGLHLSWGITPNQAADFANVYTEEAPLWEKRREFSFGLGGEHRNGLHFSVDRFRNRSENLVYARPITFPPKFAEDVQKNEIENTGWEMSLGWEILKKTNFSWFMGLQVSTVKTVITELAIDDTISYGSPGAPGNGSIFYNRLSESSAWGEIYGAIELGLGPNGEVEVLDLDGDGLGELSEDVSNLGTGIPSYWMGIQNTLKYKEFQLDLLVRGAMGHVMVHENQMFYGSANGFYNTIKTEKFDQFRNNTAFTNYYVESADFLRLENIKLSYHLPLSGTNVNVSLYAGAQNLFTLTKYLGSDPDVRLLDIGVSDNGSIPVSGNLYQMTNGIDRRNSYWLERMFYLGASVGF